MKLIAEKYCRLEPTIEYLTDEVVMAQAWKKTHGYIRTFNWYADTLALDVSALGIEENARIWAKSLQDNKPLYKLELVPAAKSEAWVIDEEDGWRPSAYYYNCEHLFLRSVNTCTLPSSRSGYLTRSVHG
jgi:hypothetical protein